MGGALLELLEVGEQDVHLTNNPQFSYFKSVYRRNTNFAIESIPQYFKENPDFHTDKEGHLMFQHHGQKVYFRNIRVRPL